MQGAKKDLNWLKEIFLFIILSVPFASYWLYLYLKLERSVRFVYPYILLGIIFLPFIFYLHKRVYQKKTARFVFSSLKIFREIKPSFVTKFWSLPPIIRILAILMLVLALARPQSLKVLDEFEMKGIDIVLVLDMSNSMKAADLEPTRLEVAKKVIDDFIKRRKTDRIGVVVFGREAYTLTPLTLDYTTLREMIRRLRLGAIDGKGTAIGNAIGVAINRLRNSKAKSKVIILLTDGDSNSGNIAPMQAAEFASTLKIKIFPILVGETEYPKVAVGKDFFGNIIYQKQRFPVNPKLLEKIAKKTGGVWYRATKKQELKERFHQILERLPKVKIKERGVVYGELFLHFLTPGLLLLILEFILKFSWWRKFP
jgi:Ca-activated chloride channel family protein